MSLPLSQAQNDLHPPNRTFPVPVPIPMSAVPEFLMTARTSAKSTFMSPGRTIISDVPITWINT